MVKLYDAAVALYQAANNAHDNQYVDGHSLKEYGEEFEKVKVGLQREEGDPIVDKRIIDGFKIALNGNLMKLTYQSQATLQEVHDEQFENKIVDIMENVVSFLKKESKRVNDVSVSLKRLEEPHVVVRHMNRTRTWVEATALYEIQGLEDYSVEDEGMEKYQKSFKKWLDKVSK